MSSFIMSPQFTDKTAIVGFVGKNIVDFSYLGSQHKAIDHVCSELLGGHEKGSMEWNEDYHAAYGMVKVMDRYRILSNAVNGKQWPINLGLVIKDPVFDIEIECENNGEFQWSGNIQTYTTKEMYGCITRLMGNSNTNKEGSILTAVVHTLDKERIIRHTERYSSLKNSAFYYLDKISSVSHSSSI